MKSLIFIAVLIKVLVGSDEALSQSQTTNSVYVLPWVTFNERHDKVAELRPSLDRLRNQLAALWTNESKPLEVNEDDARSINFRRQSAKFISGPLSTKLGMNVAIQPIWCHIGDTQVLGLQAIDIANRRLLATTHRAVRTPNAKILLNQQIAQPAAEELLRKTVENSRKIKYQPLKLDLKLITQSTRADTGSFECLNNIVIEDLLPKFNVDTSTGNEAIVHLGHILKIKKIASRPTRIVRLKWSTPEKKIITIEQQISLSASWSEGILGTNFSSTEPEAIKIAVNNSRLKISQHESIIKQLEMEANQLKAENTPTVIKTYGAWAYLDQGRSWGLKINDRLVERQNPDEVKGHVVGFYGSGLKLKTANGTPVHEGAIIYIRKGQTGLKVGQTFLFDQKTFPTPWPP